MLFRTSTLTWHRNHRRPTAQKIVLNESESIALMMTLILVLDNRTPDDLTTTERKARSINTFSTQLTGKLMSVQWKYYGVGVSHNRATNMRHRPHEHKLFHTLNHLINPLCHRNPFDVQQGGRETVGVRKAMKTLEKHRKVSFFHHRCGCGSGSEENRQIQTSRGEGGECWGFNTLFNALFLTLLGFIRFWVGMVKRRERVWERKQTSRRWRRNWLQF